MNWWDSIILAIAKIVGGNLTPFSPLLQTPYFDLRPLRKGISKIERQKRWWNWILRLISSTASGMGKVRFSSSDGILKNLVFVLCSTTLWRFLLEEITIRINRQKCEIYALTLPSINSQTLPPVWYRRSSGNNGVAICREVESCKDDIFIQLIYSLQNLAVSFSFFKWKETNGEGYFNGNNGILLWDSWKNQHKLRKTQLVYGV